MFWGNISRKLKKIRINVLSFKYMHKTTLLSKNTLLRNWEYTVSKTYRNSQFNENNKYRSYMYTDEINKTKQTIICKDACINLTHSVLWGNLRSLMTCRQM